MRNRLCNGARFGGKHCSSLGALTEKIPCNDHNCSGKILIESLSDRLEV